MKTDIFDFHLPEDRIAQFPVYPRDSSKMLVVKNNELIDSSVDCLLDYVNEGDVMVFNDTKVIPARIFGTRGQAKVEVTLFKRHDAVTEQWDCLIKNSKRLKIGDEVTFNNDFSAKVIEKKENGQVLLDFMTNTAKFMENLGNQGSIPLPPYIRDGKSNDKDKQDYQTVYANQEGAIAAPTAGLHFTDDLLKKLKAKGVELVFLTLHVGGGTFLPVKVDDTDDHVMHSEFGTISNESVNKINEAKKKGNKIISVGTTSLRLLESAASEDGILKKFSDFTNIFITPGYNFKIVDVLMTNFHLPKSTLFMLVSAFRGVEEMQLAYDYAIKKEYRFYSYGDSSLLFIKK